MQASVEEVTIALPSEILHSVNEAVDAGDYATFSEVVRDALSDWSRRRESQQHDVDQLRHAWAEASADNSPGLDPAEVFDHLEHKYQAMAEAAATAR